MLEGQQPADHEIRADYRNCGYRNGKQNPYNHRSLVGSDVRPLGLRTDCTESCFHSTELSLSTGLYFSNDNLPCGEESMATALWVLIGLVCFYLAVRWGLAWLLKKPPAE